MAVRLWRAAEASDADGLEVTMSETTTVRINDRPLRCQHCGNQQFHHRTATVDRMAAGGLIHLEGVFGHYAAMYICGACGFTHWFSQVESAKHELGDGRAADDQPRRRERRTGEEACLACGQAIPAEADRCPACGWSWGAVEDAPA